MANKAVFVDRDHTVIEDPGYLADPGAVKLLPGVELAIKSLAQAGYKIVVVTNQSGVARGLLTEEGLQKIHTELRRQLSEKGAHLDAIYYCPFHPEGTIERYAHESELRKPQPGMLLKAGRELDVDLSDSWMVGDSPRDIEAGQRAGCRTVRIRLRASQTPGQGDDEDVQADFTVRNLIDAARVILREAAKAPVVSSGLARIADLAVEAADADRHDAPVESMNQADVQREILSGLRQLLGRPQAVKFSLTRMIAAVAQVLAVLALVIAFVQMSHGQMLSAIAWAVVAVAVQILALTFFVMRRSGK